MSIITRMRERHGHSATTARKVAEVETIARGYQDLRRDITHRYWPLEHLPIVIHRPKSVVTLRRKNGEAKEYPLGSHLQAQAVLDGLDVVRGSWNQAFAKARSAAARKFNEEERHEINWLLCWPGHLVEILSGATIIPADEKGPIAKFAGNNHARLCHWLSQTLRHHRPGQPSLKHKLTFEIDMYRVSVRPDKFPVWLNIRGLTKGRPIRIPMAGTDIEFLDSTANLRVAVEPDTHGVKRIVFQRAVRIAVVERKGNGIVGIDKGANIAITATDSNPEHALFLGSEAGEILSRRSERSFRRHRSHLASRADRLAGRQTSSGRFHGNPNPTVTQKRTARHLRHNNLGAKRRDAEQRRAEAELKNITGRTARELVESFPDASEFREEKLNFRGADQKRPRSTNRKLNRWTKKELSEAIERHVSASGARREFVPAAYTSQACPRCFWTDRSNRKDDAFRCPHCEYRGHADAVASSNVLQWGSDGTITPYTPYRAVKQILLEKHAKWRVSAGTDARCTSWGCSAGLPVVGLAGSGQPTA